MGMSLFPAGFLIVANIYMQYGSVAITDWPEDEGGIIPPPLG
jgi:hypothetical protein